MSDDGDSQEGALTSTPAPTSSTVSRIPLITTIEDSDSQDMESEKSGDSEDDSQDNDEDGSDDEEGGMMLCPAQTILWSILGRF